MAARKRKATTAATKKKTIKTKTAATKRAVPWGKNGKALDGVRILDFTHVQSGPTCTQLLGYMGADCIKVERPGTGDITRAQLRDIKGVDSLYFTMLNGNKRSITIDSKHPKGKEIIERLIKTCDVLVENFAPVTLDRMGFTWERVHQLNPRMIMASVKGFGPGPYEECKVYENVAQCAGGAASTTGFREGPPLVTGAQICDLISRPEWKSDPNYSTPPARLPRLKQIFGTIEEWTKTKTKFEVMKLCNEHDIPVGPILSMKEIAEEKSLRDTGTVVEVDHPARGKYLTVGNPIKLSDSPCDVKYAPLLGEHNDEVLTKVLGYSAKQVAEIKASGAMSAAEKER